MLPLDYLGETALHKAARSGNMECVGLLTSVTSNLRNETAMEIVSFGNLVQNDRLGSFVDALHSRMLPVARTGRKRTHDTICDDSFSKKLRRNDDMQDFEDITSLMNTSVTDHDRLCSLDLGYRNALLECMLSEYHNC